MTAAKDYDANKDPGHRYAVTARLLADLRSNLPKVKSPSARLRVMDLSLVVEADNFTSSTALREACQKQAENPR